MYLTYILLSSSRYCRMVSWWRSCPNRHSFSPRPRVCPPAWFLCCSEAYSGNQRSYHKSRFQLMTVFSANRGNKPKFWQHIAFVISGALWWELTILALWYLHATIYLVHGTQEKTILFNKYCHNRKELDPHLNLLPVPAPSSSPPPRPPDCRGYPRCVPHQLCAPVLHAEAENRFIV